MKTLKDHVVSAIVAEAGAVEVISATDLRKHLGECLTLSSLGKTYCVKRKGEIVGFLTLNADIVHRVASDGTCQTRAAV